MGLKFGTVYDGSNVKTLSVCSDAAKDENNSGREKTRYYLSICLVVSSSSPSVTHSSLSSTSSLPSVISYSLPSSFPSVYCEDQRKTKIDYLIVSYDENVNINPKADWIESKDKKCQKLAMEDNETIVTACYEEYIAMVCGLTCGTCLVPSSTLPSVVPSVVPSLLPSSQPSLILSARPSVLPSVLPILIPSSLPTLIPSGIPSLMPSVNTSVLPSRFPSGDPSLLPQVVSQV